MALFSVYWRNGLEPVQKSRALGFPPTLCTYLYSTFQHHSIFPIVGRTRLRSYSWLLNEVSDIGRQDGLYCMDLSFTIHSFVAHACIFNLSLGWRGRNENYLWLWMMEMTVEQQTEKPFTHTSEIQKECHSGDNQ